MEFHSLKKEDLLELFNTSDDGLNSNEAQSRIQRYGKNIIEEKRKLRPLKIILEQFQSFLIYILIVAALFSFLIGHLVDAIVITAIIIVNASIGFFQQYKAEKAIAGLRKLLIPTSIVIRNGKHEQISSEEIVPGDILVLKSGDKINADSRILKLENLQTNEAILTGESLPVNKEDKILHESTPLANRSNMLYTGTQIVRGNCLALVTATGGKTEFGKIASRLQDIEFPKTPMQKRLDTFSKQIGLVILAIVGMITLLGFYLGLDKVETFLISVALAVSAIPEGLPAVLAISFGISSLFMAKHNVIVRKLPAVESLGSVTVICSDKTGTMTEEKMHVQEIFTNNKLHKKVEDKILLDNKNVNLERSKELIQIIKASLLCNNARFEQLESGDYSFTGDPTEESLIRMALDLGISKKALTEQEPRIKEFEFTSERKMMSIIRGSRNKTMYSKGASEKILELSSRELVNGRIRKLSEKRRNELLEESKRMQNSALRVLGFASKNLKKESDIREDDLVFLGFIGMLDPPRKEVKNAILQCTTAGINIKMVTGDSVITAKAIADQIGLKGKAISGQEMDSMSEQDLEDKIDEIVIFARTTPQQKLKITNILQKRGQTVALTGDGINDVLAIKAADVGIAMGKRGTDVARDVSDVVLLDDNFASIVSGVREGRKTYDNIKKFTKYLLAVNFSEILLILFAISLGFPLPLLPLQILWINLITDSLPALALVFEKEENVMASKPRSEKSILGGIWLFIILGGLLTFLAKTTVFLLSNSVYNLPIAETRTIVLTTAIMFELIFVYTCRSDRPVLGKGFFSNKWLNYAVLISFLMHLVLLYTVLGGFFSVIPLQLKDWLIILPFAVSGLLIFEIGKYIKHKSQ